jgi:hypothetical protein
MIALQERTTKLQAQEQVSLLTFALHVFGHKLASSRTTFDHHSRGVRRPNTELHLPPVHSFCLSGTQDQALRHDLEGQLAAACRDNCILLQRLRDTATVSPKK